ncbi:hypothetical protein E2562_012258 [Oryza meyeriana var. granulata]|uniref:Uncharacterized protein n=1 Tax=Oryza meyeriana var. granulata TaxID=110450 RepID=A0A6G1D1C3_9ORYZ|nr:hypothetical protein E2562_012258 [Oryza meyeriana var. granulata]
MRRQPSRWRRPEGKQAAAARGGEADGSGSPQRPRLSRPRLSRNPTESRPRVMSFLRRTAVEGGAPAGLSLHPPLHPLSAWLELPLDVK